MLRARDRERAAIDQLLESARAGRGGGLVLQATGVEAESALAYATLHQLLRPILDRASQLPGPQQQALRIALGLEAGSAPDRFLISLAVLTLLSEAATAQPVLVLLDDLHWADDPSREIVAFVARRLESEPIALLASVRDGAGHDLEAAGLNILDMAPLTHAQATALLDEQPGPPLATGVRDALIAAANGNPLALMELPRMLTAEQRVGRAPLPDPLPLAGELERVFLRTIDRLAPETQTVALICAAAGRGSLDLIGRAAARVGSRTLLLNLPGLDEILHVDGHIIDFRHPLMRAAVYHQASPAARRAAHLALAARMLAVAGEAAFQAGDFDMFGKIGPLLDRLPEISDPGQQLLLRLLRAINPKTSGADPGRVRQDLAAAEQLEEPDVLIRVAGLAFGLGEYTTARRLWSKAAAGARASGIGRGGHAGGRLTGVGAG